MASWSGNILSNERLLFERSEAEVLAAMAKDRWPRDTAKRVARAWQMSLATAGKVVKGEGSGNAIVKAFRAEGWQFIEEFGARITGQNYIDYLEQKHERMVKDAEAAEENIRRLRAQGHAVAAQFADPDGFRDRESPAPRRTARG